MSQGTTVHCPGCACSFSIGVTFTNVTIIGAGMNVAVKCPDCSQEFDATGGGDGTFSTIGGELRRVMVRQVVMRLAAEDGDTLRSLQRRLRDAERAGSREQAAAALKSPALRDTLALWRPVSHEQFWALVKLLMIALSVLYGASHDAVEKVTDQIVQGFEHRDTAPPAPGTGSAAPLP